MCSFFLFFAAAGGALNRSVPAAKTAEIYTVDAGYFKPLPELPEPISGSCAVVVQGSVVVNIGGSDGSTEKTVSHILKQVSRLLVEMK